MLCRRYIMFNSECEPDLVKTDVGIGQFSTSHIRQGEESPLTDGGDASPLKMTLLVKLHLPEVGSG
jgi:hypothetical protein